MTAKPSSVRIVTVAPACRNAAREADRARGRRANEGARRRADVDAAVLPAGVRVVTENEWS